MKSFALDMLTVSDAPIVASVAGQGKVKFEVKELDADQIIALREHFIGLMAELGQEPEPAAANRLIFQMGVDLICQTVKPEINRKQAVRLLPIVGGVNGELVRELAIRCGVSDLLIHGPEDDGGSQSDIPT